MSIKNPIFDIPKYFGFYQKYVGKKLYFIVAISMIVGLFEGMGIMLLLPLLEAFSADNENPLKHVANNELSHQIISNSLLKHLIQFAEDLFFLTGPALILVLILFCFVLKALFNFIGLSYISFLRGTLQETLKIDLLTRMLNVNYSFFLRKDSGFFVNLLQEQVTRSLTAFNALVLLCSNLILSGLFLVLAILSHWQFGIFAICVGVFVLSAFKWLNNKVRTHSRDIANENSKITRKAIEALKSFKYLTATAQTDAFLIKDVIRFIAVVKTKQIETGFLASFTTSSREPLVMTFIVVAVLFQMIVVREPLDGMIISLVFFYRSVNVIWAVQSSLQKTLENIGSAEVVDSAIWEIKNNQSRQSSSNKAISFRSVNFSNVSYRYPGAKLDVIIDANFVIKQNESVAFFGESGSGKSTLFSLFTFLIEPTKGRILVNGKCCFDNKNGWRRKIGFVTQEAVLFDDTVIRNIRMKPGKFSDLSRKEVKKVEKAVELAGATKFIWGLSKEYDTDVGEDGRNLSGGQKQRIALAREFYKSPEILLLDEVTSALDGENEQIICETLKKIKGKITTVIISHRKQFLLDVDRVYVVEGGRVKPALVGDLT